MRHVGRFFQPLRLLVPLGIGGLAFLVGAWFVFEIVVNATISFFLGFLFLALALGAVGALTWVFPRGCKACRSLLESRVGAYAPQLFDGLVAAVADPRHAASLAPQRQTGPMGGHRALVQLEVCPRCRQVGVVSVADQTWQQNSYWHTGRTSKEVELTPESAPHLASLCG